MIWLPVMESLFIPAFSLACISSVPLHVNATRNLGNFRLLSFFKLFSRLVFKDCSDRTAYIFNYFKEQELGLNLFCIKSIHVHAQIYTLPRCTSIDTFGSHEQASSIILAGYLTNLLSRIGRVDLNWLVSCHRPISQNFNRVEVRKDILEIKCLPNTHDPKQTLKPVLTCVWDHCPFEISNCVQVSTLLLLI